MMVGQSNAEDETKIMSMERRIVNVEEIVGYFSKTMDDLAYLCLKFDEWQRRSKEFIEMKMPKKFVEHE